MKNLLMVAAVAAGGLVLHADITYQETSQMTGGSLMQMMNMPFMRGAMAQAREPQVSTVILKGNRMAHIGKERGSIIDLDKETITEIDFAKKQYSTMTFQQMKEAMQKAMERAQQAQAKAKAQQPQAANIDANFQVNAKATGQTRTINGISAKEVVMEFVTEAKDKDSGQSGSITMSVDNWMGEIPGYEEVQAFYRKMGEKIGYSMGSSMSGMAMMRPDLQKGFEAAGKEMAKVQGTPIESVMKMYASG